MIEVVTQLKSYDKCTKNSNFHKFTGVLPLKVVTRRKDVEESHNNKINHHFLSEKKEFSN